MERVRVGMYFAFVGEPRRNCVGSQVIEMVKLLNPFKVSGLRHEYRTLIIELSLTHHIMLFYIFRQP